MHFPENRIVYLFVVLSSILLLLELMALYIHNIRARKTVAVSTAFLSIIPILFIWRFTLHPVVLCILIVCLYRIFNVLRIVVNRMHVDYLRRSVFRTSICLYLLQVLFLGLFVYAKQIQLNPITSYSILLWSSVVIATILLLTTSVSFLIARPKKIRKQYTDADLPTLSVLIPARNETTDLDQCVQSVLASDYPKLEVIVLDDCSSDGSAGTMRKFAQNGVRFISSKDMLDTWLPKNQAYQALLEAASGEYVLFCGVDVRFMPGSLRKLMAQTLSQKLSMLSVLPQKYTLDPRHAIFQPLRYFWELSLPRFISNRPGVLSTAWIGLRKQLIKEGGFAAARRMIIPEAYFARQFFKDKGYRFVLSNPDDGLRSTKGYSEQRNTALRTRYPQLHRRPEFVCLLTIAECLLVVVPIITVAIGTVYNSQILYIPAVIASSLLLLIYLFITMISSPSNSIYCVVMFPIAVLADMIAMNVSMWRYEFGTVSWKDRNICVPVMHVYPHLPKT